MKKTIIIAILIASIGMAKAQVGIGYNYIISSNKTSSSPTNLFAGNGHSVGISYSGEKKARWLADHPEDDRPSIERKAVGYVLSLRGSVSYQTGNTSQTDLTAFAKTLTAPLGYKIMQSSTNWKQVVVMGGPVLRLGKRNNGLQPFDIDAQVGAAFKLSPRRITIDRTDGQAVISRVFDKTDKGTTLAWQVNASVPVFRIGDALSVSLNAGYGFNGGNVGVTTNYFSRGSKAKIKANNPL